MPVYSVNLDALICVILITLFHNPVNPNCVHFVYNQVLHYGLFFLGVVRPRSPAVPNPPLSLHTGNTAGVHTSPLGTSLIRCL